MAGKDFRDLAVKGIQWNFVEQFAVIGITLLGTVILSRLLFPEHYGLFGMITVLTNLLSLIVSMGLGYAVIQNHSLDHMDQSTIFWFNVMFGVVLTIAFYFSAPLIAAFYEKPELTLISQSFCVIFILQGLNIIPQSLLMKRMQFKDLAISQTVSTLASYVVAILLSFYGLGVWALLSLALTQQLIAAAMNIYLSRWVPQIVFLGATFRKVRKFSGNLLASQIIDYTAFNFDNILIGKYLGNRNLGLFGRSQALVMMPVTSFGFILNKTMFPWFSALQKDNENLQMRYIQSYKALLLVIVPVVILIGIFASEFTMVLFGELWMGIAPFVALMSAYACFSCINSFNDSFLVTQGKTNMLMRLSIVEKTLLIICLLIGLKFGIMGIILGKVFTIVALFVPRIIIVCRVLNLRVSSWLASQTGILFGILIAMAVAVLSKMAFQESHYFLRASLSILISASVYYFYLRVTNETTSFNIVRIGKERWREVFG